MSDVKVTDMVVDQNGDIYLWVMELVSMMLVIGLQNTITKLSH